MKKSIILLFIVTLFTNYLAAKDNKELKENNNRYTTRESAEKLYAIWVNANNNPKNNSEVYANDVWEKLFENEYKKALEHKDNYLLFKLSLPLSFIYHSNAKFDKALPLLKSVYLRRNELSLNNYKLVLVKLEEIYRGFNDIENAIIIRKERIEQKFINNFWEIYMECGLFEAAKKDLLQFVPIPPINTIKRMSYYFLLGDLLFQMKQFDSAKIIYTKALNESIQFISYNQITNNHSNFDLMYWKGCFSGYIAKCDIEMNHFENTIPLLLFDLKYSKNNTDNIVSKMISLSRCYQHLKMPEKSKLYLDSAKVYIKGKVVKHIQMELMLTESSYYTLINKHDSALYYYKEYNKFRDLLSLNIQKNQSILILVQLEINKRREELENSNKSLIDIKKKNSIQNTQIILLIISLLSSFAFLMFLYKHNLQKTRDKKQIEIQNDLLKENTNKINDQFKHNEILLKELHHRVKNNLQVIYSLLNLQKRRNTEADTITLLSSVQNRIQTMALLHQNLYNTGDMEMVDIGTYVTTLTTYLISIYKLDRQNVNIIFEIDPALKMSIETVVSVGLIINEAVSNSFKYAFTNKKRGELFISIHQMNEMYTLVIKDDGPGFTDNEIKENSLGMKLINVMCAQLRATYSIEKEKGVTHVIKFNINN